MNNKVLVKLIVPYLSETYELFVPINKRISISIKLIEKALSEMTNGYYVPKENTIMLDGETGNVYDINIRIKEAGIVNGTRIILL